MRSQSIKSLLAALVEPNNIESGGWGPVQIGVGAVRAGWDIYSGHYRLTIPSHGLGGRLNRF